jgi:hypothetical protein
MQIGMSWHLIRSVIAANFLLSVACGTMAEAQSGLLLGLHRECGEEGCETEYRTLWIAPQTGTLQIIELPDLIVPRETGFWRIGTRFYCDPDEVKNDPHKAPSPDGAFFAAPVNQRPTVYGVVQCPAHVQYLDTEGTCGDNVPDGARGINVSFVNGKYISLDSWGRTDCGGHPDGEDRWSVERLGDPAGAPIVYGDIEGKGASDEYTRRAAHALNDQNSGIDRDGHSVPFGEGDHEEDMGIRKNFPNWSTMNEVEKVAAMQTADEFCFPKHDDEEWYIARNQGRWRASGYVRIPRLCGGFVDFELPLHASFAGPAAGPISLEAIKNRITIKDVRDLKMIKGVKDLFWSPNHELLVVIVNTDKACISNPYEICSPQDSDPDYFDLTSLLQIYLPHGQDLGKPVISVQLKEFEGPVMAEWATGSNVARWTAELSKIKAQGTVNPLLSSSSHP